MLEDGTTLNYRYEMTELETKGLCDAGYPVTVIWECEFDQKIKENPEVKDFVQKKKEWIEMKPLNPRDAFYGGRIGPTKSLYVCGENEQISYIDICSLYPYVCKMGKFPKGHADLYIGHDECMEFIGKDMNDLSKVEGLIKCDILPPRDLYHPVLPVRMHDKLLFPLCRSCSEQQCQTDCPHENIKDRMFSGTWVVDEVKKAISKGYRIIKIHEIWQYEVTQFDLKTGEGGFFAEFVKMFLKFKTEASGFPDHVKTLDEKLAYIAEYLKHEDITLDIENIKKNPGLRAISKLILNCFWGKFGQRENMPTSEIVKTPQRFFALLSDAEVEVCGYLPIDDTQIVVSWRRRAEAVVPLKITNVVIAAYTTCQARLTLYNYLEALD